MSADWFDRDGQLTTLSLERHLAGEIDVSAHLAKSPQCAARLAALQAHAAGPQLRPPQSTQAAPRWPIYGGLLAAAAAVAFFVLRPAAPVDDGIRVKGSFALEVHAHDGTRSRQVFDGDTVKPGDRLGFRAQTKTMGHLLILGRDARGDTYLVYPQTAAGSSAGLGPSETPRDLQQAIRLDALPGDEQILGVLCTDPVEMDAVAPIVAKGQAPDGCQLRRITLKKLPATP
jgi:hypothetical protein